MATLIQNIDQIKQYVSTAFNFAFANIEPYVKTVERQKIKSLLGEDTYNAWATTAPTTGNPLKAYNLFMEASANLSTLHYIPIGVVNIGDNGITVSESQHTKTASYGQILDLKRSLLETANTAIDEALELMEANPSDFPLWTPTSAYTVFKELMVQTTQEFQRFFNIQNSRQTFIALRPYQLEIQSKIFRWLDANTFFQIKEAEDVFVATLPANLAADFILLKSKEAKELAQRAQVNYTVATAAQSGVFLFKSTGLFTKYAELPVEKHHQLDDLQLQKFIQSRASAAEDAMQTLKQLVTDHADDVFTDYTVPTDEVINPIINTKSTVSF